MFKPTRFSRVFAAWAAASAATAAYADCVPISSVPYSITQSGAYCVTASLSTAISSDSQAIAVWASNVDIDFQGHSISNTTTSSVRTAGVHLMNWDTINNVTVRNGRLSGFVVGVNGSNINTGNLTTNLTVDHMTIVNSRSAGILLQGTNLRVTNNTVTLVSGSKDVYGIWITDNSVKNMTASNRAVVEGNTITGIKSTGKMEDGTTANFASATGISVSDFPDVLIRDNRVSGIWMPALTPDWFPTGFARAVGINVYQVSEPYRVAGLIVQDNTVLNGILYTRNAKTNSAGIVINNPGDHAIVTGSDITAMNTGIEASMVSLPGTPPVLLLNNSIKSATTPINGGVTLPN